MAAVSMRVRSELRARRRSTLALALLIGLSGGAVMTAVAGARRTDSAYPRFLRDHNGADLIASSFVGGESFFDGRPLSVEEFAGIPSVEAVQLFRMYVLRNPFGDRDADEGFMTADARSAERGGPALDTFKLLEGRLPDPSDPSEAVVSLPGSRMPGLRVGARFRLEGLPEVFPDFARAAESRPLEMTIVGRVAAPGDFPPQSGDETLALHLTPAFYERYPETAFGIPGGAVIGLDDAPGAPDRFRAGYVALGGDPSFTIERPLQDANVQRSIHLQAVALWLLGGIGAGVFVLVFGQTLSRQISIESGDHGTLRALGISRTQLTVAVLVRALVPAVGGATLAVATSVALSPTLPTGLARIAEPHPGVSIDLFVVVAGVGAIVLSVAAMALWPAWRSARAAGKRDETAKDRPSAVAAAVARAGRVPALTAGVRLALERGHGRTATPVRTTIATLTVGIMVLAAAATFAASLDHFLGTPRLYGVTWDARVEVSRPESFSGDGRDTAGPPLDMRIVAKRLAESDPRVNGISIGKTGFNLAWDDLLLEALILEPAAGAAPMPPLLEGRHPRVRPDGETQEIVLGRRALERIDASVGDTIELFSTDVGRPFRARVVGAAVVPVFVDTSRLGEAALLADGALQRGLGLPEDLEDLVPNNLFISGRADVQTIGAAAGGRSAGDIDVHIWADRTPTDVVNFGRVQGMPVVLALLLAAFAAGTLAHTLVTAVGRRRRDLAILKTMGFVRAQIGRAVLAQSWVLTSIALAVGIPVGVSTGRWTWRLLANDLGVTPQPVIYTVTIVGGIAATLLIAAVISILPARHAANTRPALVLRTE